MAPPPQDPRPRISSGIQLPLTGFSLSLWAPVLSFLLQLSQRSEQRWVLRREDDGRPPVGVPSGHPGKRSGPQEGRKDVQRGSQPTPGPLLFFCWKSSPTFTGVEMEDQTEDQRRSGIWGSAVSLFGALPTLGQAAEEASQSHN